MAASREEVLANFQACTGIDDVAECIMHLEECNWDLLTAVNRVIPPDIQALPSELTQPSSNNPSPPLTIASDNVSSRPMDLCNEVISSESNSSIGVQTIPGDVGTSRQSVISFSSSTIIPEDISLIGTDVADDMMTSTAGPSQPPGTRLLNFNIEYRDKTIPLVIPDSETIAKMKTIIQSEVGVPPSKQDIKGWKNRRVSDYMRLSSLNLPKDNSLYLIRTDQSGVELSENGKDSDMEDCLQESYRLNIKDETNNKDYSLNFLGSKTIFEVKRDVYSLTDIPVRHQVWQGWPPGSKDSSNLVSAGISSPIHLRLKRSTDADDVTKQQHPVIELSSDESSGDEFEDANESFTIEDDIFSNEMSKKSQPLMPEDVEDDLVAVHCFNTEFVNRYGECHPMFFQGTLEDALKEACFKPARDRKLLLIYLHHDASVLTNVFCTQLLCSETIVSYITSNFITWAWDLTFESNQKRLLAMVTQHFGSVAATTIRNLTVEQLPLTLVITRSRSTNEVFSFIHANVSLDELMTNLIHAVDVFTGQQAIEGKEEDEREARESVKREQDTAYEASLFADRAKEETRKAEEEQRMKLEEEEQKRLLQIEEASRHEEAIKEAIRLSLEQQLPDEPLDTSVIPVIKFRIRLPTGDVINRRFYKSNKLQVLLNFVASKGFPTNDYKVLSSWPRRDLTTLDENSTLHDLNLYPQETLTLEER